MTTENKPIANRDERGRLLPGHSLGRKHGSSELDKLRALIQPHREDIVAALAEAAKKGDARSAELLLERLSAKPRPQPARVAIPGLREAEGLHAKMLVIIDAAGDGLIAPEEARAWLGTLADASRIIESTETEQRLRELEKRLGLERASVALDVEATDGEIV
jgi:hypothetical protein